MIFMTPGVAAKCVTATALAGPLKTIHVLSAHAIPPQSKSHPKLCCPTAEVRSGELQD